MSIEDFDHGLSETSSRLSALLSTPAEEPKGTNDLEGLDAPELPSEKPRAKATTQRNTVAPQPQEAAPEDGTTAEDEGLEPETTIEAPTSWDATSKALWAKLPDDVKAVITARETDRDNATKARLAEAAEIRRVSEEAQNQANAARTAHERQLVLLGKQLEATIPEEFRSIKTQADLQVLVNKDPSAWVRFQAWREMVGGVVGQLRQIEADKQAETEKRTSDLMAREAKALVEKLPEVLDPVKAQTFRTEIASTLKGFGFTDEEIGGISDHRILLFAKQYNDGQKALKAHETAKAKLEKKPLPKVQKPAQGEATNRRAELSTGQLRKVASSGDLLATQGALEKLLSQSPG